VIWFGFTRSLDEMKMSWQMKSICKIRDDFLIIKYHIFW
jgi:hypothetical protein